jgi:hypothetical protein
LHDFFSAENNNLDQPNNAWLNQSVNIPISTAIQLFMRLTVGLEKAVIDHETSFYSLAKTKGVFLRTEKTTTY